MFMIYCVLDCIGNICTYEDIFGRCLYISWDFDRLTLKYPIISEIIILSYNISIVIQYVCKTNDFKEILINNYIILLNVLLSYYSVRY